MCVVSRHFYLSHVQTDYCKHEKSRDTFVILRKNKEREKNQRYINTYLGMIYGSGLLVNPWVSHQAVGCHQQKSNNVVQSTKTIRYPWPIETYQPHYVKNLYVYSILPSFLVYSLRLFFLRITNKLHSLTLNTLRSIAA